MATDLTIFEQIVREIEARYALLTLSDPGGVYGVTRTVQKVTRDGEGADQKVETKPLVDIDTTQEPERSFINIEQIQAIHTVAVTIIDDRVLNTEDEFDIMTLAMGGDNIKTMFTDRNGDRDVQIFDLTDHLAIIVHPGPSRRFSTDLYGGSQASQVLYRIQFRHKINDPTVIV